MGALTQASGRTSQGGPPESDDLIFVDGAMTAAARSTGTRLTGPSPAGKANGRGPRAPPRTRRWRPRTRPAVVGETMELSRRAPETESSRIAARVRFHLFRSKSEWVMREVHLALARKQGDDTASSKGLRSCPRRRSSPAAFQRPHRLPAGGSCAVTMVWGWMCGGVRDSVEGPRDVYNCHCGRSRRFTGHHMAETAAHRGHVLRPTRCRVRAGVGSGVRVSAACGIPPCSGVS